MRRRAASRARPHRGSAQQRWLCLPAAALFLLLGLASPPVLAQETGGDTGTGPESLPSLPESGVGEASPSSPNASPNPATAPPIESPEALPSLPQNGFGVASPIQPPNASPNPAMAPAPQPSSLRLPPPGAGIVPLQTGLPGAPAILIRPRVSIGETITSNARNTASDHVWDLETQPMPGLSISADTPRLVGVLTGNLSYNKYIVATNQDQLFGNLYATGTATAIPDHLFFDVRSAASQTATFGAAGFAPISQLSTNQMTQIYTNTASPYIRYSYGGLVDAELRYRVASTIFGGNTLTGTPPPAPFIPGVTPAASALSNSLSNDGTLTLATGSNFERLLSRLTIDTSQLDAAEGSVIPNTRVSAYDDLEYRFASWISALGRLGYENIRYPFAPAATTSGILWQIGGRLVLGPDNQYLSLRYGKQEGIYGVNGSLRWEITPVTVLTATASQGVGSQQEEIGNNLAGSSLDIYGQLVDQYNLPTAFANPEFAPQNNVFRSYLYKAGVTTTVGSNRYTSFGFYNRQVSLALPQPPTTSIGVNFGWSRSIRPDLTVVFTAGYAKAINQTLLTSTSVPATTTIPSQNTVNASLGLNYLLARNWTASIIYSLFYTTHGVGSTGTVATISGNVVTNRLEFLLTKTF